MPLQIIEATDLGGKLKAGLGSGQELTAVVHPAWRLETDQLAPAAAELLNSPGTSTAIVPVGDEGMLLWDAVDPRVALLAGRPGETAAILMKDANLLPDTLDLLWRNLLAATAESLLLCPGISAPPDAGPACPLLVPKRGLAPAWLETAVSASDLLGSRLTSRIDGTALEAGLLQLHDELDLSHQRSQSIEGQGRHRSGDYWHAIMHRREPDYGNSKYWFRRVGPHPAMHALAAFADDVLSRTEDPHASDWQSRLTKSGWDPFAFVDLCQQCREREESPLALAARRIQRREMILLFATTFQDATVGNRL